uniref:Uncharacterized protein n=1 Tax=Siphoviridae sp. ctRg61 TaxID=2826335 RepID=A0A8S5LUZ1_9CAUD|nr:MAG TPA: hypothetical protein [Siphoviridae sp. ctRg61]
MLTLSPPTSHKKCALQSTAKRLCGYNKTALKGGQTMLFFVIVIFTFLANFLIVLFYRKFSVNDIFFEHIICDITNNYAVISVYLTVDQITMKHSLFLPSVCRNLMSFSSESGIPLIQHLNRRNVTLLHNTGFNVIIKPNAGFIAAAVPFRLKKDNVCSSFPAVFFYEPYFMTVAVEHCFTIHKLLLRTCGDEMCSIF